jgi:hypothetical protein
MDYFGYSLWSELLLGNRDWFTSLELGDPDEFDPEGDFWSQIFRGLNRVLQRGGLNPEIGGCLHISYTIAQQTADTRIFNIFPHYCAARDEFIKQSPFELGVHMTFNDRVNPLGPDYARTFLQDLENSRKLGATTMVVHPVKNFSYNQSQILEKMVDDATRPEINDALRASKIVIAWENMIEGQFSSLEQLLRFRQQLAKKLEQMGESDLIQQHLLCLDTGHLLIWRHQHPSRTMADQEINACLPQFAELTKAFHIHGNDGSSDYHITPKSTLFMDHPTRKGLDLQRFQEYSDLIEEWLKVCNRHAKIPGRHIHLETDKVPFSLDQTIEFGRIIKKILK